MRNSSFVRTLCVGLGAAFLFACGDGPSASAYSLIAPEMVRVEGGAFTMGCTPGQERVATCEEDEALRSVTVESFSIGKYEVTQEEWQAVMGSNPAHFQDCGGKCPVEQVSWSDIQKFLKRLNEQTGKTYRLPTEEEWEFAARGGKGGAGDDFSYAGGDDALSVAWFVENSDSVSHPVGGKASNQLGLFDMSGNVWEWTSTPCEDSLCTAPGNSILRGGSLLSPANGIRVGDRANAPKDFTNSRDGFRLAL
jgi:formylglycine-generating enzyme required for sulfatase activity